MLAGLKEFKNWAITNLQPALVSGEGDYMKIEYDAARCLREAPAPKRLTYEEESRIKSVILH
ncbi:hypothetical protein F4V43_14450 [Paenibacillus spiritus]|uniref:Uncharacterized protein n=1 Tax=Paenibacillus spiritus TaxID=2496557 RepID=A0A5J5G2N6_9BACL|nr:MULTISPECIES: hypothetical protein [Paenibacillus]KAA9000333.1 hypothetical protein F4V43_14450 [Paenibacillus spiritus]